MGIISNILDWTARLLVNHQWLLWANLVLAVLTVGLESRNRRNSGRESRSTSSSVNISNAVLSIMAARQGYGFYRTFLGIQLGAAACLLAFVLVATSIAVVLRRRHRTPIMDLQQQNTMAALLGRRV